jgi:hypothetical protein
MEFNSDSSPEIDAINVGSIKSSEGNMDEIEDISVEDDYPI